MQLPNDVTLKKEKKLIWNLHSRTVGIFLCFYVAMGFTYWLALFITSSFTFNAWQQTMINYFFKFLWLIPVYWLIFWKCRDWPLYRRLWLHVITMPLYVFCWVKTFYFFIDVFLRDIGHLTGPASFWDIYIGSLLYFVQFGALHIYENYVLLKIQQEKEQALERLAHAGELRALKAQIQPHFLFNTLNSISASVPSHLEHTRELIAKLADTFRFALHDANHETITLDRELSFISAYLDLEKERFSDRLQINYQIDESLLQTAIPPMLLQPLIENALTHGIAKSVEGGTIAIIVEKIGGAVQISICDTGAGLPGTLPHLAFEKGIGLNNTRLRLQKLYGSDMNLEPNYPSGVKVSFRLPIKKSWTAK